MSQQSELPGRPAGSRRRWRDSEQQRDSPLGLLQRRERSPEQCPVPPDGVQFWISTDISDDDDDDDASAPESCWGLHRAGRSDSSWYTPSSPSITPIPSSGSDVFPGESGAAGTVSVPLTPASYHHHHHHGRGPSSEHASESVRSEQSRSSSPAAAGTRSPTGEQCGIRPECGHRVRCCLLHRSGGAAGSGGRGWVSRGGCGGCCGPSSLPLPDRVPDGRGR